MQETLICMSLALFVGLMMNRVAKLAHLPAVTGYLVTGLLLGPFCVGRLGISGLGFCSLQQVESYAIISDMALGFIAFTIGNEFRIHDLRAMGRQAVTVGIVQAVFTTLLVDLVLVGMHFLSPALISLPSAVTLGAIAAATAPAATLMVVRQYKADGPRTRRLLMVVAVEDAVGLIVFSISYGVATALESGSISLLTVVVEPLVEIVLSVLLGLAAGLGRGWSERYFHYRWTTPRSGLCLVLSGADQDLNILKNPLVLLVGAAYIFSRSLGKISGAYLSSTATGCSRDIRKYLGITLLPQAGVALGMAQTAAQLSDGQIVRNVVLFSVLVYELVGPALTKMALTHAGEIRPDQTEDPSQVPPLAWQKPE